MEPRRYHHGDLKRTLIEVAESELARHGYEGLSLRGVAKRAGVSHTAPYRHFSDKSQLLGSVILQGYQRLLEQLEDIEWRCPENLHLQLRTFAGVFVEMVARNPRKAHFMFCAPGTAVHEDLLADIKSDICQKLNDLCREAQNRGEIRSADTLATAYWSALVGLAVLISSQDPMVEGCSLEDLQSLSDEVTASLLPC